MNMIFAIAKHQRFGRIRQIHTIISQDTIKPSSPIPPHLRTHNLSSLDHGAPDIYCPWIFFYPNYHNNNGDINILKKSLSHCLTQYYPFAGRFPEPYASCIDCNDAGVKFLEASIDSRLNDFVLMKEQDETLDQLVPNPLSCFDSKRSLNMMEVQLNHFTCGGAALTVSMSHKVGDGFTMVNFCNLWASITRGECGSLINPTFLSSSKSNKKVTEVPTLTEKVQNRIKRFVFPNSKLNELKNKVNGMGIGQVINPTRFEALTSLLFKCAVASTTAKSGNFSQAVNLRNKLRSINSPKSAAGNIAILMTEKMTVDSVSGEIDMNKTITNMRKVMMELQGIRDEEEAIEKLSDTVRTLGDDQSQTYIFSSVCRFPIYQVDFGWGKPVQVIIQNGNLGLNFIILMDTPSGDGIEVTMQLEEHQMAIFEKDEELLSYM